MTIPPNHPRRNSLETREQLIKHVRTGVVTLAGLIAHGRGEAFDYLIGETTTPSARKAIEAAAAQLLLAKNPVISVNGNVAALSARQVVELSLCTNSKIEVNLFYRDPQSFTRERAIKKLLVGEGAKEVLGCGDTKLVEIPELGSERRRVDPRGIMVADTVLVPLEDGDRTEALKKLGKKVISIDLNPFSRTSQQADISIVDNITRALPLLTAKTKSLRKILEEKGPEPLLNVLERYDNRENLRRDVGYILERLERIASKRG
ncbi:MAG: hypothetical protein DRO11_01760 [Methanobacteriota archaeon]|nr:MAG: hypothetical protein DRO11_01760 [Euryarchaeota archaeon]